MKIILVIAIAVIILALFLFRSEAKLARSMFREAASFERDKKFMEACYYYAISGWKGHKRKECMHKIRSLWREHGPFDFAPLLQQCTDSDFPSCGKAGHEITLDFVEKTLSQQT